MSRLSSLVVLALTCCCFLPLGARGQTNLIANPGFESGATALDGMPATVGVWGGDQNTIVVAENGITPLAGTRMLKFGRSAPTADPSNGDSADAIQLVDVSAFAAQIAAGTARFRLSANFNRIAGDASTDTRFLVEINAYSGLPSGFPAGPTELARVVATVDSDANLATWQAAAAEMLLPAGTTYVGLWVSAVENVVNNSLAETEFAGHYADGVAFGLVPDGGVRALANISTRATAGGSGQIALASNFTIEGSAPKTVLIRGIGPRLADFSVTGFLADPVLVVYNGFGQRVGENDNWGSAATSAALVSATSAVGAFSLVDDSRDAALLLTLSPGTYHARLDGASGGTGEALLEIYDTDTNSRLVNLSANHRIAAANGSVQSGFVITGTVAQTVLIRAVGPALTSAGVLGMAADPRLTVFSGAANLASNDNWGTAATAPSLVSAAATAGLRPLADGSADAALLLTLAPGAYTIQAVAPAAGNVVLEVAQIDSARAATVPPALIAPVVAVAGGQGGGFRITAPAIGNPAPTYQWSKNGTAIAGATTPALILSDLAGPDAAGYSVTIANSAGSVIAPALSGTVWSLAHPSTLTGSFNAVAYGGSVYAAAGDSGMIFTSTNGTAWSRITPSSGTTTRAIAYGGGRFVAVASSGVVRYSTDQGATWPTGTSGTTQNLLGVIHDGTRFVAVGANSTVLYSTDGQTWTAGNLGTASITLNAVAYKPSGNYVAVASNGTIYHTADVTTGAWTALPTTSAGSNTTNGFNAVAFLNDRFVAVGNSGTIRTSTTGAGAWNTITSPTTNTLRAVAYNGTAYVATGGNTLVTSTAADASSWTAATILPVGTASSNALIFAGGQFVSAGFPGTIVTSPSGAANTWTLRTAPSTANFNDSVYAAGRYVAVGSNAATYTSADGVAGTVLAPALPSLPFTTLRRVAYGAGRYVAVGDAGTILVSSDAATWQNRSFGSTNYTALTYAAGKFVAAGAAGAYVTSVDGETWTPGSGTIGANPINGLAYGGSTPVFVAVDGGGGIFTSPDAATWTARSSNTTNALNNVRFAGGQFIALGANSTLLTSSNGTAWTHRAIGASGINLVDLAHGGGYNVLVHTTSTSPYNGIVFVSQDNVTWSPVLVGSPLGTPVNFFAQATVTYGNGSFLIASNSGIIARSLPHTGLQRILTQPVNATLASGGTATLSVSTSAASGSTFQWYRGASGDTSTPIAGATNASYTASVSDRYWVQVAGASSPPIASATAAVTGPAPVIGTQPVAAALTVGQSGGLTVSATPGVAGGTVAYQWRKFGLPLPGATAANLNFAAAALTDAGYYDVVVSDGLASVTSQSVRVDVAPAASAFAGVYRPRANAPRIEANSGNIAAIAVDPADGNKLYVAGEFTRINGTVRLNVARFLANGDFDPSWTPVSLAGGGSVRALLVESDGVIIAGDFSSVGGTPRGRIAKLSKTDGSLIAAFAPGAAASGTIYALARQVMADASVRYLVGGSFTTYNGTTVNRLARIDSAGGLDAAFVVSPTGTAGFGSDVRALLVDGTGDTAVIYAGGLFTSHHGVTTNRNRLVRLTASGAYDPAFDVGSGFNNTVTSLALTGTGASAKLHVGGLFTTVRGLTTTAASPSGTITLSRIVRLTAAGAIDNTFAVGTSFGSDVNALALDSVGNVYVGGAFTSFNGTTTNRNRLLRLTSTGAYDTGFNNGLVGANSTVNTLLLLEDSATPANSRLLAGGFFTTWNNTARDSFARIAVDATAALDAAPASVFRRPGTVYALEPAPAGKWYVGGFFNFIDDQVRNNLARFNADGTLDPGFTHAGSGFNSSVYGLAIQGDGRLVVVGNFNSFAGTSRGSILRLLPDGTLDPSFNPGSGFNFSANALQLAADGRIAVVGNFTTYNGTTRNRVARLLPDGSLDATFDPVAGFTGGIPAPGALALQSDGKLLVGGTFTTYNGTTANGLVRILGTGLIDSGYNSGGAGFASNTDVRQLFTRLDDELVVSGAFTTYNGTARSRIARVTPTGAIDTTFAPNTGANNTVTAFYVQPDDKTILAGFYNAVLGVTRNVFSRFNANGTLDAAFLVPTVVNPFNSIQVVRPDAAGNLLIGATRLDFAEFLGRGSFVVLEPAPVPAITTPPVAQTGVAGGSVTFAVTATGENLTYQWRKDAIAIPGATNATLNLTNLTLADVAEYSVVVANAYGSVASAAVPLTGSAPAPTITASPAALHGTVGGGASFSVTATGTGPLGYQWRKFGVPLAGATTATLSLSNLGLDSAGYYDVVVSDGLSVRPSPGAHLAVSGPAPGNPLRPRSAFEPRVETNGQIYAFAPLSDGRYYAGGSFTTIDGVPANSLARFNADGTHDTTWTATTISGTVTGLAVQADGKILIAGGFIYVGGRNSFRLARLNADGSVDNTFVVGSGFSGGAVNAVALQPDQKILVGGAFTGFDGRTAGRIIRLHPDGRPDTAFATGTGFDATVSALALQPDGKLVVGGAFTTFGGAAAGRILRLNADGSRDTTLVTGAGFNSNVTALALYSDGRLLAGGNFATYDGAAAPGLARLSAVGALDTTLALGSGIPSGILSVALQADGKIVLGGQFVSFSGNTASRLVRIDGTTGALDTTLAAPLATNGINNTVRAVAVQPGTGRILAGGAFNVVGAAARFGFARFNVDGSLDSVARSVREPGQVFAIVPTADGKFIVGGFFNHVGGVPVSANLARIDAAGALDASFVAGTGANGTVNAVLRQGDGKLVVAGAFTTFSGTTVGRLVRLSADGALDTAFVSAIGSGANSQINAVALSPDGRIVLGGTFGTFNGATVNRLARLNADGTLDAAFNAANGTGFSNTTSVASLAVQPDGRIVAGGSTGSFNGSPFNGLMRLLPGGGADPSFATGSGFALNTTQINGVLGIRSLVLQPDGRLLVGGVFTTYNGSAASCIVRLEPTGALDHSFVTGSGFNTWVDELLLQADGSVIAAGGFATYNGQRRGGLARLTSSGALDPRFGVPLPTGGFPIAVGAVAFGADGSIVLGHVGRSDFIERAAGALLQFEAAPSPALLTLPFAGGAPAGTTTQILTVSAAGTPPLSYQWKRNGTALTELVTDVTGTATDTLRFANLQAVDTGDYTVTVTDGTGATATTPVVTLTVLAGPPVLGQIAANFGPVLQAGTPSFLSTTYAGTAPSSVVWSRNGTPISGGFYTAGSLVFPFSPVTKADEGVYQVTATNASGTVTTAAVRLWVAEESGWVPHNPLPSPQGLTQVYVANNRFYAGGVRGARFTSLDGIAWTPLPALSQNNLFDYHEGNGLRLLVGSLGFVALSTDGNNWRTTTLPTLEPVQASAFGAGLFVVSTTYTSSPSGGARIFSSPDGVTWTQRYATTASALNSMAYGNGTFAIFTGQSVLRSADGIAWTSHAAPATGSFIRFANSRFFIASASTSDLHVSTDALTWTTSSYGAVGANSVVHANNTYLLTGDNGLLLTSPDAVTWTRRATGLPLTSLRDAAYNAGTWVVLSESTFPAFILTSTDNGVTWTNRTTTVTPNYNHLGRIATDGTTAMVVPAAGGVILRTTDGTTWSQVASGTTDNLEAGTFGGGKYLVAGANGRILTSADGTTWTAASSGTTQFLNDAYYLNNTFVVVGDNGSIVRSTDAATWTAATFSTGTQCQGLAYGAGRFVAVFRGGAILTSTDAVTWTAATSGTTADLTGVAYGNGKFLVGSASAILTSTDGLTWTSGAAPEIPNWDGGAIFLNGRFYAGAYGNNGFISSADGVTWTGHHFGSNYSEITSVAVFKGRTYAVGEFGLIISSPLAPEIVQPPTSQPIVVGAPAALRVLVAGSSLPVSYQWQKGGVAIPGATGAAYHLPNATANDAGSYDVVVTTSAGSVTSSPVSLTVSQAPTIVAQPASANVAAGGTLTLQVTVSGAFPMNWQWRRNGEPISGATSPFYSKHSFASGDAGTYDVVVTNAGGSITSSPAVVALVPDLGMLASDATWARPSFQADAFAGRATVDSLGRVYATWTNANFVTGVGSQQRGAVIRLAADGTLDTSFSVGAALVDAWAVAVQPDGKVLVGGIATNESSETGPARPRVFRFNADGSRDFTYNSPHFIGLPRFMTLQSDGRLLVVPTNAGLANDGIAQLARLNTDGSLDTTFAQPTFNGTAFIFAPPVVDAAGKIYIGGTFTSVNSVARLSVARLNADGTVDSGFVPSGYTVAGGGQVRGLALQTEGANAGKLLVAGGTFAVSNLARPVIRLGTNGALDTTFNHVFLADIGMTVRPRLLEMLPDDRFYVVGASVARLNADGTVDSTYTRPAFSAEFFWMDAMDDGRVVVAPEFGATINGSPAPSLVRFTATGAVDSTFTAPAFNRQVYPGRFAILPDSRLLTWGSFDRVGTVARPGIARFNLDGTLDSAFNVTGVTNLRYVAFAEVGTDGRILAGTRTAPAGSATLSSGLVRLLADGSVDSSFALDSTLAGRTAGLEFRVLGDNRVAVWLLDAQAVVSDNYFLHRLSSAGTIDPTFNPDGFDEIGAVYRNTNGSLASITLGALRVLAHDSAGRLILRVTQGGHPAAATSLNYVLLRMNPDGTRDTTFNGPSLAMPTTTSFPTIVDAQTNGGAPTQILTYQPAGSPFTGVVPQADGKLLVFGGFTALGGQPAPGLARLNLDGSVDPTLNLGTGAALRYQPGRVAQVGGVNIAADGKLWVTGAFDTFNGVAAPGIVRLLPDGSVDANFATDIFYRTYLGGVSQTGFAPNGSVYVSGTYSRSGDAFPTAIQRLVNAGTPAISVQPVATLAALPGGSFSLAVTAAGGGTLAYQWRKDGVALAGATASTYGVANAAVAASGRYDVVVSNLAGSVASSPAQVTVAPTVAIVDQPVSRKVAAGGSVTFNVSATTTTSGAALTYQWRKGGNALPGLTADNVTFTRLDAGSAGSYTVAVGDGVSTVVSEPAVLTVTAPDPILWQQFTELSMEQGPARTVHDGAGKVYLPWSVYDRSPDVAGGRVVGALARFVEATGAHDPSFRLDRRIRAVTHAHVQPDGKLLLAARLGDANTLLRVTGSGEIDTAFAAPLFARSLRFFTVQADGKIVVVAADNLDPNAPAAAIGADALSVYRLNPDGGLDTGFTRATVNFNIFGAPVVDSTGRIYLAGAFTQVNGTSRLGVARLLADGTLDSAFPTGFPAGFTFSQIRAVALQSGDRPVFVGDFFSTPRGTSGNRVMAFRFTAAGAFDSTFAQPLRNELGLVNGPRLRHLVVLPDDKILVVSDRLLRLNADGSRDTTFTPRVFGKEQFWLSRGQGGRLFFPDQTSIAGQSVAISTVWNGIATTLADGTPDFAFQTGGWGRSAYPDQGVVLSDGRIVMAGEFNRVGSRAVPGLVLLEADGSVSSTQSDPNHSHQSSSVAAAGGAQVYALIDRAANSFDAAAPQLVRGVPGTPADTTFVPVLPSGYSLSSARLHAAPGGKLMLAQGFVSAPAALAGSVGDALLRLNVDGSRDTGYAPSLSAFAVVERNASNQVTAIKTGGLNVAQVLPDSRALVIVSAVDGNLRLLRLAADGSVDSGFNAPSFGTIAGTSAFTTALLDPVTGTTAQYPITTYSASDLIRAAVQMPDGKIYVGGRFQLSGAPRGLVRLNADGTLDSTFTGAGLAAATADGTPYVDSLVADGLGRLYVGGRFGAINGTAVSGLARFTAAGALDTAWSPGFAVVDAPVAAVQLIVAHGKLHALGTVGLPNDAVPASYRAVALTGSPTASPLEASSGGVVTISAVSGFTGATSVTFNGVPAAFTVVSDGRITATVPTFATSGPLVVSGAAGPIATIGTFTVAAGPRLASLSTRSRVGVGEAAIVGSFTIEGTANQDVLLRAVGPTLGTFGVTGVLADPVLTLHDATGAVVASNDDWPSSLASSFSSVGAFAFPAGSKDAALRATLAPGSYSARVVGAGGTTGVALLELYEFTSTSRLSRLAVRQNAGTGADVSIVGFFYSGSSGAGKDTLIRAAGSSLTLPGALANPTLSLFAGSTNLGTNDNWGSAANVAALTAADAVTGGLPLATADAAVYQRLATGSYTAQVSGVGGTFGLVSIEIFPIDGLRASTIAPALTAPLLDRSVVAGAGVTFVAPHIAKPAATYQWLKDGNPLDGQTGAALVLASVTESSAGNYAVRLANSAGTMTSAPAVLTILSHHSADTSRDFALDLPELLRVIQLYNARAGNLRTGAYAVGTAGVEDGFAPDLVRTGSATLARYHSADTNRDGRLSLVELTRVIELYNYRVGTNRTGQYKIQSGTEDGFGLGP